MLAVLILVLAALWFFGYIRIGSINFPDIFLFTINGQQISLLDILILFIVIIAISILPRPFREIAGVLLIVWILAVLGVLSIAGIGLPSILVFAIIIGLIASLLNSRRAL